MLAISLSVDITFLTSQCVTNWMLRQKLFCSKIALMSLCPACWRGIELVIHALRLVGMSSQVTLHWFVGSSVVARAFWREVRFRVSYRQSCSSRLWFTLQSLSFVQVVTLWLLNGCAQQRSRYDDVAAYATSLTGSWFAGAGFFEVDPPLCIPAAQLFGSVLALLSRRCASASGLEVTLSKFFSIAFSIRFRSEARWLYRSCYPTWCLVCPPRSASALLSLSMIITRLHLLDNAV